MYGIYIYLYLLYISWAVCLTINCLFQPMEGTTFWMIHGGAIRSNYAYPAYPVKTYKNELENHNLWFEVN